MPMPDGLAIFFPKKRQELILSSYLYRSCWNQAKYLALLSNVNRKEPYTSVRTTNMLASILTPLLSISLGTYLQVVQRLSFKNWAPLCVDNSTTVFLLMHCAMLHLETTKSIEK
jgi:predicted permease